MKKILKLTLAVALMMCATVASAQKFGRVDLAAIVPNMPEFKEAQCDKYYDSLVICGSV